MFSGAAVTSIWPASGRGPNTVFMSQVIASCACLNASSLATSRSQTTVIRSTSHDHSFGMPPVPGRGRLVYAVFIASMESSPTIGMLTPEVNGMYRGRRLPNDVSSTTNAW
jgi:hypothetical protein